MDTAWLLISKYSSTFNNPLVIVLSAPIIVYFVLLQGLSTYLSFQVLLILYCGLPGRQSLFLAGSLIVVADIIIYSLRVFHISFSIWFFSGVQVIASLFKSPEVSRTLLSILAFPNNVVIWMVSTRLLLSYSFESFHTSVSWLFSTPVLMTPSLLKSPGLFSVFWPFSIMLNFGWSPLIL